MDDPGSTDPSSAPSVDARGDGEILMEDRVVRSVDEAAVRDLAREQAAIAFSRYDISPYLEMQESFWDSHTLEDSVAKSIDLR